MDLNQMHFATPAWLWLGVLIPLVWMFFLLFYGKKSSHSQLEKWIDPHLLPYLLLNQGTESKNFWKPLLLWSLVWTCMTLSLAGPRWNLREIESFSRDQSLIILLDLSESMNATDARPSRLTRAKQVIEDLLHASKGVKIGLIAFAADPHMMTPLTEDKETLLHLLPSIETDLVFVQGSRLSPALEMANRLFEKESGHNRSIVIISDGDFEDSSAIVTAKKIGQQGTIIYTIGVGTLEGAPLYDQKGNALKENNHPILSKLDREKLKEISEAGQGSYFEAYHSAEEVILQEIGKRAQAQTLLSKKIQTWDEQFYWLLFPIIPAFLWWFRKGFLFALLFFFLHFPLEAYFANSEQLGQQVYENGEFEKAADTFQDPYRKGVSHYKAGNFAEAEKLFRQSSREEVASSAAYNLGNALAKQQKFKEAITAYEDLLKQCPDHKEAKENLELIKKMVEQSPQDSDNSENESENQKKSDQQNSEKQNQDSKNDSKENQEDEKNSEEQNKESQNESNSKESENEKNQDSSENNNPSNEQEKNLNQNQAKEAENNSEAPQAQSKEIKSQDDQDADLWLNRLSNEPKDFLKNKFYLESKKNGTTKGMNPW